MAQGPVLLDILAAAGPVVTRIQTWHAEHSMLVGTEQTHRNRKVPLVNNTHASKDTGTQRRL